MPSSNRNPKTRRQAEKDKQDAYAARDRAWIERGIDPYDPPSAPAAAPEILSVDDPYWRHTRREVADAFLDSPDKRAGMGAALARAAHVVAGEHAPAFASDVAEQVLDGIAADIARDGPDVDHGWAEAQAALLADGAAKAYELGAWHSSAALAAAAESLKLYALDLLIRK